MQKRNSMVETLEVKSLLFASVVEVGDTVHLKADTKALAVQRTKQLFYGNEGDFDSFKTYSKPIPIPPLPFISMTKFNEDRNIRVGNLNVITMSASAILQVGSTEHVDHIARVLHIRQVPQKKNIEGKLGR